MHVIMCACVFLCECDVHRSGEGRAGGFDVRYACVCVNVFHSVFVIYVCVVHVFV